MNKNVKKAALLLVITLTVIASAGFITGIVKDFTGQAKEAVQVVTERVLVPGGQSVTA